MDWRRWFATTAQDRHLAKVHQPPLPRHGNRRSGQRPSAGFVDTAGRPASSWWTAHVDAAQLALPMFLGDAGRTWTTDDSRTLFREVAQAAGLDPSDVHARSARIGGATDARARLGEAGKAAIQRRGRWCSEVAQIYQRELLEAQLQLSADIGDVLADSLEELGLGWVQPACV